MLPSIPEQQKYYKAPEQEVKATGPMVEASKL